MRVQFKLNPPTVLFCLITLFWTVAMVLSVVQPTYTAPTSLHALMMLAAGWAFGKGLIKNGDEHGDTGSSQ